MEIPTAELFAYAAISGIGLLLAVYAMLQGSVLNRHTPAQMKAPPAAFNTPVAGVSVFAFGATGYLFSKYGPSTVALTLIAAIAIGAIVWIGMTMLMAKWAYSGPIHDPHEELEELQGTVGSITRAIGTSELGEVSYYHQGEQRKAPARSIDGNPVAVGTDVVIDKIENGIADVELWSVVETRL